MLRQCDLNKVKTASKTMSPAARLRHRDYSAPGLYFVTVCANYKRCIFGKVIEAGVELSPLGRIARECWTAIPLHFARVNLHGFMVMPNHLHGIVEILAAGLTLRRNEKTEGERLAQHAVPLQETPPSALGCLQPGSLSAIVRSFKAEVTRRGRLELSWVGNVWQRNYFDRVIRHGREFANASRYIAENPTRWQTQGQRIRAEHEASGRSKLRHYKGVEPDQHGTY
jgi:REP element-mobilizing transposase RayT